MRVLQRAAMVARVLPTPIAVRPSYTALGAAVVPMKIWAVPQLELVEQMPVMRCLDQLVEMRLPTKAAGEVAVVVQRRP